MWSRWSYSNRRCDSVCQTNASQDGPLHSGYTKWMSKFQERRRLLGHRQTLRLPRPDQVQICAVARQFAALRIVRYVPTGHLCWGTVSGTADGKNCMMRSWLRSWAVHHLVVKVLTAGHRHGGYRICTNKTRGK